MKQPTKIASESEKCDCGNILRTSFEWTPEKGRRLFNYMVDRPCLHGTGVVIQYCSHCGTPSGAWCWTLGLLNSMGCNCFSDWDQLPVLAVAAAADTAEATS